jgi:hypothetical protein
MCPTMSPSGCDLIVVAGFACGLKHKISHSSIMRQEDNGVEVFDGRKFPLRLRRAAAMRGVLSRVGRVPRFFVRRPANECGAHDSPSGTALSASSSMRHRSLGVFLPDLPLERLKRVRAARAMISPARREKACTSTGAGGVIGSKANGCSPRCLSVG